VPVQEVQRTDFVGVNVRDRAHASDFYGNTLGLKRNPVTNDEWPEFGAPNVGLVLSTPDQKGGGDYAPEYSVALRVAVGEDHVCALLQNGDVYCWGDNTFGQLGRAGAASATPVKVSGGFVFTSLSAGRAHTCAVEAGSGAIGCWGSNNSGQLGDGTTTDRDHPVAVVAAE
jgi:alpha-tubulin suppressor-like RCC1 family protein